MKTIFIIFICLLLSGCFGKGVKIENTNNSNFEVTLLFEVDGCKVYRFSDGGFVRYFTTCQGSVSWNESCGRNCHQDIEIPTSHK